LSACGRVSLTDNGRMTDISVRAFYDDLAATYDQIYPDWAASAARQGTALDALLTRELGPGRKHLLDCACGIGTQLLGLAPYGHRLVGTDLSPLAVTRAAAEAKRAGLATDLALAAADLRALPFATGSFDGLVCADNSVPHLLTDADLLTALREMHRVLRSGGAAIVTTRDYDAVLSGAAPTSTPPQRFIDSTGRRVVTVQLWDWAADGAAQYVLTHLQATEQQAGQWETRARTTTYRAWLRQELLDVAVGAGFRRAGWLTPAEAAFFQPVLVLRS
jgi:glycine/sarcosine N-methyltransferase